MLAKDKSSVCAAIPPTLFDRASDTRPSSAAVIETIAPLNDVAAPGRIVVERSPHFINSCLFRSISRDERGEAATSSAGFFCSFWLQVFDDKPGEG
ncbi:MAG: hypothetical protein ACEPO2_11420 [Pelagibaca sp.]